MIQNSVQKINYCGNNLKVNTMKKHISLVLAFAAAIACTKLSPEDLTTIEPLPQKENTENISEESRGERITIKLPQTKVTLDGDTYVFESGDAITVVATNGAKAVLTTTSAAATGEFSGDFDRQVGLEKDNFTFYYNYNGTDSNEQNGKPWLIAMAACTRVDGTFTPDEGTVNFKQPSGIVAIAIKSSESYTVDFCSIDGTQKYENLSIVQNVPFFLNVNSGLPGGFYLAVHNGDQVMYTRYGNDGTTITANTPVTIKPFVAFTGVQNLKITGFETTYSYYIDGNSATNPNGQVNSWMNGGTVTFSLSGISSSLVDVKFNDGDYDVTGTLEKSGSSFKYTFGSTENHTTFGAKTLTATVSFKAGIEPGAATETTTVRHITGLPYKKDFTTDKDVTGWYLTGNEYYDDGYIIGYYYSVSGKNYRYDIFSPTFYIPKENTINAKYNVSVKWWNTGSKLSSGSSTLHTGITSNNQKKSNKTATLTEKTSKQSLTLSDEQAELSESKNQVVTYIDSASWPKLVQHFVLYNKFEIYYR